MEIRFFFPRPCFHLSPQHSYTILTIDMFHIILLSLFFRLGALFFLSYSAFLGGFPSSPCLFPPYHSCNVGPWSMPLSPLATDNTYFFPGFRERLLELEEGACGREGSTTDCHSVSSRFGWFLGFFLNVLADPCHVKRFDLLHGFARS